MASKNHTDDEHEQDASNEDTELRASLSVSVGRLNELVRVSSLYGDIEPRYPNLYLNLLEDEVQILQAMSGEAVLTYCTFNAEYFEGYEMSGGVRKKTVTDSTGQEFEYNRGVEVNLDVKTIQTHLSNAEEDELVEFTFIETDGEQVDGITSSMKVDGITVEKSSGVESNQTLETVPHWLPARYSSNEVYTNTDGDEAPTRITTTSTNVESVIRAISLDQHDEFYPVVVEEGEFMVDAKCVEGPDVENYYFDGFIEIFQVLSGQVELQTAPGNNPLAVVQRRNDSVIRHIIGPIKASAINSH